MTPRRPRFRLSLPPASTTALLPLAHALLSLDLALVARPRALRSPLFHLSAPFSSLPGRESALASDLGAVALSYALSGILSGLIATGRNLWNDARAFCGADEREDTDTSQVPYTAWSVTAPAVYLLAMVLVAAHAGDGAWPYPLDFGTLLTVPLAFLLVFTEHHFARLYATLWKSECCSLDEADAQNNGARRRRARRTPSSRLGLCSVSCSLRGCSSLRSCHLRCSLARGAGLPSLCPCWSSGRRLGGRGPSGLFDGQPRYLRALPPASTLDP